MFAILHCVGKKKKVMMAKARALYCLLQEGGFEKHTEISAGDKDVIPVFEKICSLVTHDIFKLAHAAGVASDIYTDDEVKSMLSKDNLEILREDQWLEQIYGAKSRLENDQWLEAITMKANWILKAEELRTKVLGQAGIDARH